VLTGGRMRHPIVTAMPTTRCVDAESAHVTRAMK
jgi:hypothetical protein